METSEKLIDESKKTEAALDQKPTSIVFYDEPDMMLIMNTLRREQEPVVILDPDKPREKFKFNGMKISVDTSVASKGQFVFESKKGDILKVFAINPKK